jgi:hypothetical protein
MVPPAKAIDRVGGGGLNLHASDSVFAAKAGIARYVAFYNAHRLHTALDREKPDHVNLSLWGRLRHGAGV